MKTTSKTTTKRKHSVEIKTSKSIFKEYEDFPYQWHFDPETGELTFVSNQFNK